MSNGRFVYIFDDKLYNSGIIYLNEKNSSNKIGFES